MLDCSLSRKSENHLARVCHEIAHTILLTYFSRRLEHFRKQHMDDSQVAFLCIERLFHPRNKIRCFQLYRFFSELDVDLETVPEQELLMELRRIVYRKVQHAMSDLYEESDPDYGRILRRVKNIVRNSPHFATRESVLGLMVWKPEEDDLFLELPEIPPDRLLAELSRIASPDNTTEFLMHLIFTIVHNETHYRRWLSIANIAMTLRRFYALLQPDMDTYTPPDIHSLDRTDLERLANETLDVIYDGCIRKYNTRGILSEAECLKYRRAIRNFLLLRLDGQKDVLFSCFKREFPGVTRKQYWDHHRNIFSYIATKAWNDFEQRCKDYFKKI